MQVPASKTGHPEYNIWVGVKVGCHPVPGQQPTVWWCQPEKRIMGRSLNSHFTETYWNHFPDCVAKGSHFTWRVWGLRRVCLTLLLRPQPSASVRRRLWAIVVKVIWPSLWYVLRSGCFWIKTFEGFKRCVACVAVEITCFTKAFYVTASGFVGCIWFSKRVFQQTGWQQTDFG